MRLENNCKGNACFVHALMFSFLFDCICEVSHIFGCLNPGKETVLVSLAGCFSTPNFARQEASATLHVSTSLEEIFWILDPFMVSYFKNRYHLHSSIHPGALAASRKDLSIAEQFWMQLSNILWKNWHQMHMTSCIFINYVRSSANNKRDGRRGGNTK